LQADQLLRERSYPICVTAAPTKVHPHVAAIHPTRVRKGLREGRDLRLRQGIVFVDPDEHVDALHAVALLRARRERPSRRAAERSDEFSSCNGGGHLPAPVLKPKANDTMIGMVGDAASRAGHMQPRWNFQAEVIA
jgi:hypothetical protein